MSNEQAKLRRTIIAEEDAVIDFRFALIDLLDHLGVTKEQLAKRLGVTKSRVSQLFASEANPTLKQVARILDAVDYKLSIKFDPVDALMDQLCIRFERIETAQDRSHEAVSHTWASVEIEDHLRASYEGSNDNHGPWDNLKTAA